MNDVMDVNGQVPVKKKKLNVASILLVVAIILLLLALIFILVFGNKKKYVVNFDSNGGSFVLAQNVEDGTLLNKPDNPTKDGYEFLYWEYNGSQFNFSTKVTEDIILKAVWESSEKYTITFDTDGGKEIKKILVNKNEKIVLSSEPEKDGYAFEYWSLNNTKYDLETPVTEDITLKAVWRKLTAEELKNLVSVTFNSDGGSTVKTQKITKGTKITKPTNPTRLGYEFVSWQLDDVDYDFNELVKDNITLKATWKKVNTYTITFNSDGGSSVKEQVVNENSKATKPTDPTKNGFTFCEWYLNNTKYDFNQKVTGNITLVAHWKELEKYTITFDSDGGSSISNQVVTEGQAVTKPTDPIRNGFTFYGWYLNNAKYDFNQKVTGNITLVAHWMQSVNKYTVTFDSNGGSNVSSQTINEGKKATRPSNPTKSGYTFDGWQLNGAIYSFDTPITGNITLKAEWIKNKTYTIKINQVDKYSPDVTMTVYENDTKISVSKIKFTDGVVLCGSNTTVYKEDISGETKFIVVLTNGTEVTATVVD